MVDTHWRPPARSHPSLWVFDVHEFGLSSTTVESFFVCVEFLHAARVGEFSWAGVTEVGGEELRTSEEQYDSRGFPSLPFPLAGFGHQPCSYDQETFIRSVPKLNIPRKGIAIIHLLTSGQMFDVKVQYGPFWISIRMQNLTHNLQGEIFR